MAPGSCGVRRFGHKVGSHECEEARFSSSPRDVYHGRYWPGDRPGRTGPGLRPGAAGHPARDRAAAAGLLALLLHLGEISSYPPGYKENAGIFCHTNPWIMLAEARCGHADRAFDYYRRINRRPGGDERAAPLRALRIRPDDRRRDAPTHGEAKNSWLTGTAAWNYVAITQAILGIRPTYAGCKSPRCSR